ncbi:MAG: endonuclease/exonuclease/phosphatase family protein [Egibacteraceae bacterium]
MFAAMALAVVGSFGMPEAVAAIRFKVLQLNLCNSGFADCYKGGQAIGEGIEKIKAEGPDVVSLNEVCRDDVSRMGRETGYSVYFSPARKRTGDSTPPYQCKNGQEYGIGFMARQDRGAPVTQPRYRSYANQDQDPGTSEIRVMACGEYASFAVCVTHLATTGSVASKQCDELMSDAVDYAGRKPTVVAGDLNLKYGGSPDVQSCVRSGFFRKGDGSMQHVMASTPHFGFVSSHNLPMRYTDHPGFVVSLSPK